MGDWARCVKVFVTWGSGSDRGETIECKYFSTPNAMTDRNIDQINHNLDQVLAISADNTRNIAQTNQAVIALAAAVTELMTYTRNRTQQHDEELDDHDVRVERLERDHADHADRMAKLEDIQADIRGMMQMLARRLSGE
jgi:small-conductance mechanosensitive channel